MPSGGSRSAGPAAAAGGPAAAAEKKEEKKEEVEEVDMGNLSEEMMTDTEISCQIIIVCDLTI